MERNSCWLVGAMGKSGMEIEKRMQGEQHKPGAACLPRAPPRLALGACFTQQLWCKDTARTLLTVPSIASTYRRGQLRSDPTSSNGITAGMAQVVPGCSRGHFHWLVSLSQKMPVLHPRDPLPAQAS